MMPQPNFGWLFPADIKSLNKKTTLCFWHLMPHSIFCLRILFSSSTKFLSEVACPMSRFLFSFCWNVSTRRFLADISPLFESSSSDHQSGGERKNGKFSFSVFIICKFSFLCSLPCSSFGDLNLKIPLSTAMDELMLLYFASLATKDSYFSSCVHSTHF